MVSERFSVETEYPSSRAASSMLAIDEVGPNSPIVADRMPSMFDLLVTSALRGEVRAIVQHRDRIEDLGLGLRPDAGVIVQHPRDGLVRDARQTGDITDARQAGTLRGRSTSRPPCSCARSHPHIIMYSAPRSRTPFRRRSGAHGHRGGRPRTVHRKEKSGATRNLSLDWVHPAGRLRPCTR